MSSQGQRTGCPFGILMDPCGFCCPLACCSRNQVCFPLSSGSKPDTEQREGKVWCLVTGRRGGLLLLCPCMQTCRGHTQCLTHPPRAPLPVERPQAVARLPPSSASLRDFLWAGPRTNICRTFNSVLLYFGNILMLTGAKVPTFLLGASPPPGRSNPQGVQALPALAAGVCSEVVWSHGKTAGGSQPAVGTSPAEVPVSPAGCVFMQRCEFNKCVFF